MIFFIIIIKLDLNIFDFFIYFNIVSVEKFFGNILNFKRNKHEGKCIMFFDEIDSEKKKVNEISKEFKNENINFNEILKEIKK